MAHYDLGLYISHHLAKNRHCGMDWDSLIILFLVAFIFLFQARPWNWKFQPKSLQNQELTSKTENTPAKSRNTSEIILRFWGWAVSSHDLNWFCTTAFLIGQ